MAEAPELRRALAHPPVRVDQFGYQPGGPKVATWITDSPQPHRFSVWTRAGDVAYQGWTMPVGLDVTSGFRVQLLDFTDLGTRGRYLLAVEFVTAHLVAAATGKDQDSEKVYTLRS